MGFKKLSKLIGQFKHSPDASQELEKLSDKKLILPSATRRSYWIRVLKRYLEIQEHVKKVARRKQWSFPDADDTLFMQELVPVLDPFAKILEAIQAENKVTISNCYTNIKILKTIKI
jgi:molecular chaperone GrpE (heat shock protein)